MKEKKSSPNTDEKVLTSSSEYHEIILFNDDFNTFQHVIEVLVKVCDHSSQQAEQCAYIVHYSGKCAVKTGGLKKLSPICSKLLEYGLSAEIS